MWPFASQKDKELRYRSIDPNFAVAGQVQPNQIAALAEAGFKTIVCARPDDEEPGQPSFATIAMAAEKLGLKAVHIPISSGISEGALIRMGQALNELPMPMYGYCRSGARAGSLYGAALRARQ